MSQSLISVVVPVYREECSLPKTLKSIGAQTLFPYTEVILARYDSPDLIDNLVEDVPLGVARRCQIVDIDKKGIGYARNKGVQKAKGKFIINFDADATFTTPNDIQGLLAPIQSGTARMTQANVTYGGEGPIFNQIAQDVNNSLRRYIPYIGMEIGMCFTKADYNMTERFKDVRNMEGARISMDFIQRFGWSSIQKVEDVVIHHENRRFISDLDHERAYRSCNGQRKVMKVK